MATLASARRQFQDVFSEVIVYTAALDLGNAATGSGTFASTDIAIPGAALGDVCLLSLAIDPIDAVVVAQVTAPNVVTVTLLNNTAGAVNLASATVRIFVLKASPSISFL